MLRLISPSMRMLGASVMRPHLPVSSRRAFQRSFADTAQQSAPAAQVRNSLSTSSSKTEKKLSTEEFLALTDEQLAALSVPQRMDALMLRGDLTPDVATVAHRVLTNICETLRRETKPWLSSTQVVHIAERLPGVPRRRAEQLLAAIADYCKHTELRGWIGFRLLGLVESLTPKFGEKNYLVPATVNSILTSVANRLSHLSIDETELWIVARIATAFAYRRVLHQQAFLWLSRCARAKIAANTKPTTHFLCRDLTDMARSFALLGVSDAPLFTGIAQEALKIDPKLWVEGRHIRLLHAFATVGELDEKLFTHLLPLMKANIASQRAGDLAALHLVCLAIQASDSALLKALLDDEMISRARDAARIEKKDQRERIGAVLRSLGITFKEDHATDTGVFVDFAITKFPTQTMLGSRPFTEKDGLKIALQAAGGSVHAPTSFNRLSSGLFERVEMTPPILRCERHRLVAGGWLVYHVTRPMLWLGDSELQVAVGGMLKRPPAPLPQ